MRVLRILRSVVATAVFFGLTAAVSEAQPRDPAAIQALAARMAAALVTPDAPAPKTAPLEEADALLASAFRAFMTPTNKAKVEALYERLAAVDVAIYGASSEKLDRTQPRAAMVLPYALGQWAARKYLPLVSDALDADVSDISQSTIFNYPFIGGPAMEMSFRTPYDRKAKRVAGAQSKAPLEVNIMTFSPATKPPAEHLEGRLCANSGRPPPFAGGGASDTRKAEVGEWRNTPTCDKERFYTSRDPDDREAHLAHWRSSHGFVVNGFRTIIQVNLNGPLLANPGKTLFDLKNMPLQPSAARSARSLARDLLAALEKPAAHDVVGFLSGDGVPPVEPLADDESTAIADRVVRAAVAWSKANGAPLSHSGWGPVYAGKVGHFIAKEEGTSFLLRSGKELAFYNRLKSLLATRRPDDAPLDYEHLIVLALDLADRHEGKVYIDEVYLTVHNVIRLLARPEQWARDPIGEAEGIRRDLPIRYIMLDILGARSTDKQPTLAEIVGEMAPPNSLRWFRPPHPNAGRVIDASYSANELFHPERGLFRYQKNARTAHWSAGCHYYFWVGALGHRYGRAAAVGIGDWKERAAKDAGGEHDRAVVQLSHMHAGGQTDARLNEVLE